MSYKITKKNEATKYEAPGHFECLTTRLHNPEDVNDGTIVMGLSHFLPGGGANMAPAKFEMVYYIQKGEMTVTLDDGKEYVLSLIHICSATGFSPLPRVFRTWTVAVYCRPRRRPTMSGRR